MNQDMNQSAGEPIPSVAIVMGSKSDYEVMKESAGVLKEFGVTHEVRVFSKCRQRWKPPTLKSGMRLFKRRKGMHPLLQSSFKELI